MKTSKPRGKTPSLIGSSLGRPRKRDVKRKSHCRRCEAEITGGIQCYEIPQLGGTFSNHRPYCDACYRAILEQTKADLDGLFVAFQNQ